ncbi:MAG: AMP-binding protein, partial [Gemmatimonadaceae bacterium]|nr:AMP-binding protein [Gemmatimonadaceae bacterium]
MTDVVTQFQRMVGRFPDAVALEGNGRRWSYRALDEETSRIATALSAAGARPGRMLAMAMDRSVDEAMLQLSIVKTGAAYVPLDPAGPDARWERLLGTLDEPLVIATDAALAGVAERMGLPSLPWPLRLDEATRGAAQAPTLSPDMPAYVMFTSGSTGEPKGVLVPHRGIVRLVVDVDYVRLGEGRAILHAAPLSFDAATFELWGAWLTGGRCVVHDERMPTAAGLGRAIREARITTLWLTAGLFNAIIDEDPAQLVGLDELLIGGEALSVSHVRRAQSVLEGTTIINGYGPTETTTFAATYRIPPLHDATGSSIPIGMAIPRTELTIHREDGALAADGEVGELYIGGDGVALGYVGATADADARFVNDPQPPHARRYRTGDLVRRTSDGLFEY